MIFVPFKYGSKAYAVKCAITGNQGGKEAVEYVMSSYDHEKKKRSVMPIVLEGDPELMSLHLSNNKFANQYLSCVLTFNEDNIDRKTLDFISKDFTRMLFPGLEEYQISKLAVLHKDKGKTEIHFIFGKEELTTGKFIKPYFSKRDFVKIDSWQNAINAEFNLSDPKHPLNRQMMSNHQKDLPTNAKDIKTRIYDEIIELNERGIITDRESLLNNLVKIDGVIEVSRITPRNISVKVEGHKKPIRLKGSVFEEGFNSETINMERLEAEAKAYDADRENRAKRERAKAEKHYRQQARENKSYFKPNEGKVLQAELYTLVDDNILAGKIGKRQDIVELIKQQDKVIDVVDTHKQHISVYYEGGARPFRMTGEAYKREGDLMKYMESIIESNEETSLQLQEQRRREEEYLLSGKESSNDESINMKAVKTSTDDKDTKEKEELNKHFRTNYGIIGSELSEEIEYESELTAFDLSIFEAYASNPEFELSKIKERMENNNKENTNGTARTEERSASEERAERLVRELITRNRKPRYVINYISRIADKVRERFNHYGKRNEKYIDLIRGYRQSNHENANFCEELVKESEILTKRSRNLAEQSRRITENTRQLSQGASILNEASSRINDDFEKQIKIFRAKYGYSFNTEENNVGSNGYKKAKIKKINNNKFEM